MRRFSFSTFMGIITTVLLCSLGGMLVFYLGSAEKTTTPQLPYHPNGRDMDAGTGTGTLADPFKVELVYISVGGVTYRCITSNAYSRRTHTVYDCDWGNPIAKSPK